MVNRRDILSGYSRKCRTCSQTASPQTLERAASILAFVAKVCATSPKALKGERRTMPLAEYRQFAMWLVRRHTTASLPAIGKVFGNRHHTTVLYSIRVMDERVKEDASWREFARETEAQMRRQAWFGERRAA